MKRATAPIWTLLWAVALSALPGVGGAENLLANPGFEVLQGEWPARWQLFVAPQEGAEGTLDSDTALDGRFSILLHIPTPYEVEPANNWSQNIVEDLGGKELLVSGWIRTENATEAAIWVQCCQFYPWRVLKFATTSTDTPRYGTSGWSKVEMRVKAPERTDYLVFRCVLKGRGTAWFDSVAVEDAAAPREDLAPIEPDADTEPSEAVSAHEPPGQAEGAEVPEPVADNEAREPQSNMPPRELLEAVDSIIETNRTLRAANARLEAHIDQLEAEVDALRDGRAATSNAPAPNPWVGRVPPLVPHGYPLDGSVP